jgi:proton glutamate symport protein
MLVIKANQLIEINSNLLLVFRLLCVLLLIVYAVRKKSLTTWILVCMVAGAEFGYDVPSVAKKL